LPPRIGTNSLPFLPLPSRGTQVTEIHDWWSQRAEQLSLSQGSSNSASVASPSPPGAWMTSVLRGGWSEQPMVRNFDFSDVHTGEPKVV